MKNYIPSIQKLAFNFPHVHILVTYHCGKERREEFKCQGNLHDVLFLRNYKDWVVSSYAH